MQDLSFQTSRDHLVVGFTKNKLADKIELFADDARNDHDIRTTFFPGKSVRDYLPGDTRQWSLSAAREYLQENEFWRDNIKQCLYRPFDHRFILYDSHMVDWPRPHLMTHGLRNCLKSLMRGPIASPSGDSSLRK